MGEILYIKMGQHLRTFLFILCFSDFIFYLLKYIIITTQTRSANIHTKKTSSMMLQNRITLFGLINNLSISSRRKCHITK